MEALLSRRKVRGTLGPRVQLCSFQDEAPQLQAGRAARDTDTCQS